MQRMEHLSGLYVRLTRHNHIRNKPSLRRGGFSLYFNLDCDRLYVFKNKMFLDACSSVRKSDFKLKYTKKAY